MKTCVPKVPVLLLLLITSLWVGCDPDRQGRGKIPEFEVSSLKATEGGDGTLRTAENASELPPCCRKAPEAGTPTDGSLYQLESTWISDVGRRIPLGHLRGRPQVVAMFFTRCEYACPILVHDMKRIEEALPSGLRDQVDFLLISMDSERDDPGALKEFRVKSGLAASRWTLLTGSADDVREVAALLGVSYQRDARGQYAHSNLVTLLNAEGEVAFQLKGLNQSIDDLVRRLGETLSK